MSTPPPSEGERAVIELLEAILARLRAPGTDPIARAEEIGPLVAALTAAWEASNNDAPSPALLGLARAYKIEIDKLQARLQARGRALARLRRLVDEARGATYDRAASRVDAPRTARSVRL